MCGGCGLWGLIAPYFMSPVFEGLGCRFTLFDPSVRFSDLLFVSLMKVEEGFCPH